MGSTEKCARVAYKSLTMVEKKGLSKKWKREQSKVKWRKNSGSRKAQWQHFKKIKTKFVAQRKVAIENGNAIELHKTPT